jgi:hypothetical protein
MVEGLPSSPGTTGEASISAIPRAYGADWAETIITLCDSSSRIEYAEKREDDFRAAET